MHQCRVVSSAPSYTQITSRATHLSVDFSRDSEALPACSACCRPLYCISDNLPAVDKYGAVQSFPILKLLFHKEVVHV